MNRRQETALAASLLIAAIGVMIVLFAPSIQLAILAFAGTIVWIGALGWLLSALSQIETN